MQPVGLQRVGHDLATESQQPWQWVLTIICGPVFTPKLQIPKLTYIANLPCPKLNSWSLSCLKNKTTCPIQSFPSNAHPSYHSRLNQNSSWSFFNLLPPLVVEQTNLADSKIYLESHHLHFYNTNLVCYFLRVPAFALNCCINFPHRPEWFF